jgi:CBS domain-containing protein
MASARAAVARERMRLKGIHHLVVTRQGMVVGIISSRDLGSAKTRDLQEAETVADRMSPYAVTATPTTTVRRAANQMRGRAIGCLPIVNKGRVVGIVTISDLLEVLAGRSEKVVSKNVKRWTLKHRVRPRQMAPNIG